MSNATKTYNAAPEVLAFHDSLKALEAFGYEVTRREEEGPDGGLTVVTTVTNRRECNWSTEVRKMAVVDNTVCPRTFLYNRRLSDRTAEEWLKIIQDQVSWT